MLVVMVILPLIVGAVTIGTITALKATAPTDPRGTTARLLDSHDAQLTSSLFVRDVQSAQFVSTATTSLCPTSGSDHNQLLGLEWTLPGSTTQVNVTYGISSSPLELIRRYCIDSSPESDSAVSHDVFTNLASTPTPAACTNPPVTTGTFGLGGSSCAVSGGSAYAESIVTCRDGSFSCANGGLYGVLPPVFSDGASSSSTSWSSNMAAFTSADAGRPIVGTNIPAGTTISNVTSPTTVVLSQATTASGSGLTFQLPSRGVTTIALSVLENQSGYQYTLTGTPRIWNPGGTTAGGTSPTAPFLATCSGVSGTPCISGSNCAFLVNGVAAIDSSASPSLQLGPNGDLSATGLYTLDTSNPSGAASGGTYPPPAAGSAVIPDPYGNLTPPNVPSGGPYPNTTANPGYNTWVEPNGWSPSGTLATGIYIVPGGMSLSGGVTSAPGGVLIYVTGGSVDLHGNGNVNLQPLSPALYPPPPSPEPVLWISKNDTNPNPPNLTLGGNGNATTIGGAIYAPTASVSMNGGGNSGGINALQLIVGSLSCSGGGSVPWNLEVGSQINSGTFVQPQFTTIVPGQTNIAQVSVVGAGALAPTGTATVYLCGPLPVATSCISTTTQVGGALTLTPGASGTSTGSSSSTAVLATTGTYCFASYYGGDTSYKPSSDTTTDGCFTVTGPPAPSISAPSGGTCYYQNANNHNGCVKWSTEGQIIQGTSTDPGGPGLQSVQVAIQDRNGNWWNGSSFVASATPIYNTASGSASWTFNFPTADFGVTGSYIVSATATDTASVSGLPDSNSFTWKG